MSQRYAYAAAVYLIRSCRSAAN